MQERIENIQKQEKEPKKVVVEIGPGDRPVVWRMERGDKEVNYRIGGETLFSLKSGDVFYAVDLPPDRSVDVWRWHINKQENDWYKSGKIESHLKSVQKSLDEFLPKGTKGRVLHVEGQMLPFADGQIDTLFMANVLGGHAKDDFSLFGATPQRKVSKKNVLREKGNLIKEAKRVLKVGGKLIIEEEYAPAIASRAALSMVLKELGNDRNFELKEIPNEDGLFVLELIKREPDRNP